MGSQEYIDALIPFAKVETSETGTNFFKKLKVFIETDINTLIITARDKNSTHQQLLSIITRIDVMRGLLKTYEGSMERIEKMQGKE